ncbi:hypothetical protein COO60DRAFT_1576127 [Scenedesmus sp. NREL 46B-D3]|nr:hypothetical protein COO60DRAFT_1576127 [Scenedesmus sp. NREL 46B-D3]
MLLRMYNAWLTAVTTVSSRCSSFPMDGGVMQSLSGSFPTLSTPGRYGATDIAEKAHTSVTNGLLFKHSIPFLCLPELLAFPAWHAMLAMPLSTTLGCWHAELQVEHPMQFLIVEKYQQAIRSL